MMSWWGVLLALAFMFVVFEGFGRLSAPHGGLESLNAGFEAIVTIFVTGLATTLGSVFALRSSLLTGFGVTCLLAVVVVVVMLAIIVKPWRLHTAEERRRRFRMSSWPRSVNVSAVCAKPTLCGKSALSGST
jgi:hypothetical protein